MTHRIDPTLARSVARPRAPAAAREAAPDGATAPDAFARVLEQRMGTANGVRFSAHAARRLESRGIQLSENELTQLETAVHAAAEKGGRESLVLLDSAVLVVNVRNRTVVTAMTPDAAGQTVVTNIDSAVLAQGAPASETATDRPDPARGSLGAADRLTRHISME